MSNVFTLGRLPWQSIEAIRCHQSFVNELEVLVESSFLPTRRSIGKISIALIYNVKMSGINYFNFDKRGLIAEFNFPSVHDSSEERIQRAVFLAQLQTLARR